MSVVFINLFPIGVAIIGGVVIFLVAKIFIRLPKKIFKYNDTDVGEWLDNKQEYWPELSSIKIGPIKRLLRFAGYKRAIPNGKWTAIVAGVVVVTILIVGGKFALVGVGALVAGYFLIKSRAIKTEQKIVAQLPEALTGVAETLRAGFSFPQAIIFVSTELPEPIAPIFKSFARGLKLGLNIPVCLKMLNNQLSLPVFTDVSECVTAGLLSGGNIIPLLCGQANFIRAELKAEGEIKSLTATGRSSGFIIAFLAPAVFLFFWFFSPSYAHVFVETLIGKILLGVVIFLEIVGFLWIQRIVKSK